MLFIAILLTVNPDLLAQSTAPAVGPATRRTDVLAAWEELCYGMFIHFGLATFNEDELGRKNTPISAYAPSDLDVDQWIRTAKEAGMQYAVLTAKHCTGHCLWPSALTDFDVAASPVQADVVGAFVQACRAHGLKPGLYYLVGWDARHQPRMEAAAYERFCTGQLEELLTRYGPIVELWLDIPWDLGPDTAAALRRIYARAKSWQPDCLVLLNQGFTDGRQVASMPPTYFYQPAGPGRVALWPRDLIDGERTLPPAAGHDPRIEFEGQTYHVPMEVCDTLARMWFWSGDDALRPVRSLHQQYRACRDRRANFLLDVAPDRTGRIPQPSVARLRELKAAMDGQRKVPENLLAGRKATASNVYRNDPNWGADKLTDDNFNTRWATDDELSAAWVQIDFDRPIAFDSAYLTEGWNRVREFQLEIPDGAGGWRAVHRGERIGGDGLSVRFPPVTAPSVRLHILKATVGPTIWDFELYRAD